MSIRSSLTSKSMNVASYESSIFHISDLCSGSGLLGKAEILDFGSSILPVANAIDIVKEKADEITLSNDDDGVAVFLEKLIH